MKKIIFLLSFSAIGLFAQNSSKPLLETNNNKTTAPVATKRVLIEEGTRHLVWILCPGNCCNG
jgi:hypothetical protein